jgi:hypothetical protein
MPFRIFAVLTMMLFVAGCAQTSAPEVAQFNNERLQISAKVTPGLFDGELKLFINEELVINQRSQAFGGSSQSFEGTWQGRQVTARATRVQNFMSAYTQIDVFIEGQIVETLTV